MVLDVEIDIETSYELVKEIYQQIKPDELRSLGLRVEEKVDLFQHFLSSENAILNLSIDELKHILLKMFSTKRASKKWSNEQFELFKSYASKLLFGNEPFEERFNYFCSVAKTNLALKQPYELASELLTFSDPDRWWIWGKWMWNEASESGSLSLVFKEKNYFKADSLAKLYEIIGLAQKKLLESAHELGIIDHGTSRTSRFDIPIFLGAVYSVYMFTITRVQMTNEFTTILPPKFELIQRLLGIYENKNK